MKTAVEKVFRERETETDTHTQRETERQRDRERESLLPYMENRSCVKLLSSKPHKQLACTSTKLIDGRL